LKLTELYCDNVILILAVLTAGPPVSYSWCNWLTWLSPTPVQSTNN